MIPRGTLRVTARLQGPKCRLGLCARDPRSLNLSLTHNSRSFHAHFVLHASPQSSTTKTRPTVSAASMPPPAPSAKKKIDLKPSPRKSQALGDPPPKPSKAVLPTSVASTISKQPSSPKVSQSPSTSLQPEEVSKTEHRVSPIQLAIEDMRKAQQHGIFAPTPEGAGRIGGLWHQAKEFFKFYFHGMKLIFVHRRTVKEIKRRLAAQKAEGKEPYITRWEWQFIRTYEQDIRKLVPFVLILVVLEEILPLVVLYVPGLLPSTCILPSQLERIQEKGDTTRTAALVPLQEWVQRSGKDVQSVVEGGVRSLEPAVLKDLCRAFNLASWGPSALARFRLSRHLEYLKQDDHLLASEGHGKLLSPTEARSALGERAFSVKSIPESQHHSTLAAWLDATDSDRTRLSFVLTRAARTTP